MIRRVVSTNEKLAAERQIHAAIEHYRAGNFECAITLCSAAEGRIPTPSNSAWLLEMLSRAAPPGTDFNIVSNWLKHNTDRQDIEIEQSMVLYWLNRAVSKYRAQYGNCTVQMIDVFPWGAQPVRPL